MRTYSLCLPIDVTPTTLIRAVEGISINLISALAQILEYAVQPNRLCPAYSAAWE